MPETKKERSALPPAASHVAANRRRLGRQRAAICALLLLLVFLVFGQTLHHQFVNLDDDLYVYQNPVVTKGLTVQSVGWVFTHWACNFYHPLTMLSLILDYQMHGLRAGGYHLTNLLLHAASAVILFLVLWRITGAVWKSTFVAAVFAVHPLKVESVAWVAERKDVLSGFFFMVTLAAYVRYARGPFSFGKYLAVIAAFGAGLLAKPSIVTLPFLLVLLDYWPLRRFATFPIRYLILEKLPLLLLSTAASVAAVFAQPNGVPATAVHPIAVRLENATVSYAIYLQQAIFPVRLAPYYPYPKDIYLWQITLSSIGLASMSVLALLLWRRRPYAIVGWCWYVGLLIPMIGLVEVGEFAHADRFTYLPQIGLLIAATWLAADWIGKRRHGRRILGTMAFAIVGVLSVVAFIQTSYWRDDITLWSHALECTEDNCTAHNNLGNAFLQQGRIGDAIAQYGEVLRINPAHANAHANLGNTLLDQGRTEEAIQHMRKALDLKPAQTAFQNDLAWMLATAPQASFRNGVESLRLATHVSQATAGDNPTVLRTLAAAYAEVADYSKAVQTAQKALQLAEARSDPALAENLLRDLKLYEAGQPFEYGQ